MNEWVLIPKVKMKSRTKWDIICWYHGAINIRRSLSIKTKMNEFFLMRNFKWELPKRRFPSLPVIILIRILRSWNEWLYQPDYLVATFRFSEFSENTNFRGSMEGNNMFLSICHWTVQPFSPGCNDSTF